MFLLLLSLSWSCYVSIALCFPSCGVLRCLPRSTFYVVCERANVSHSCSFLVVAAGGGVGVGVVVVVVGAVAVAVAVAVASVTSVVVDDAVVVAVVVVVVVVVVVGLVLWRASVARGCPPASRGLRST